MHAIDPRDVDYSVPTYDTPFYLWLAGNEEPAFEIALRRYLNIGLSAPKPALTGRQVNSYRAIHTRYYWDRHNEHIRRGGN